MNLLSTKETFFSIDIETDGPVPLKNSILSIAIVAFDGSGTEVDSWEVNLKSVEGGVRDSKTMTEFWDKNPEAWAYCNSDQEEVAPSMERMIKWVNQTGGDTKKVAVCFPSGFDFTWIYVYLMKFCEFSPFSFSSVDMKTYVSAVLKKPYRSCGKNNWPARWFDKRLLHTHKAVDDAREQGLSFLKMRAENLQGPASIDGVSKAFWASHPNGVK